MVWFLLPIVASKKIILSVNLPLFGFVANSVVRTLLKSRQSVFPLFAGFVCSVTVVFCCCLFTYSWSLYRHVIKHGLDWIGKTWTGLIKHGLIKYVVIKHWLIKHGVKTVKLIQKLSPRWELPLPVVTKTKQSKTKTEARSTQISKTKHPRLENEAPSRDSKTKHPNLETTVGWRTTTLSLAWRKPNQEEATDA